ncbi:hypothetical protein BABINDRAFT_163761, partial [Babjeviella inositovora NRRL Y-12698]
MARTCVYKPAGWQMGRIENSITQSNIISTNIIPMAPVASSLFYTLNWTSVLLNMEYIFLIILMLWHVTRGTCAIDLDYFRLRRRAERYCC